MNPIREILLEGQRFRVVRIQQRGTGDSTVVREIIEHPGAVAIVPMVDAEHVCLIENQRIAVGQRLIEIPAGTLDLGEQPVLAARRELAEETGYHAGRIEPLAEFFMSPGILQERMHVFVASDLTPGQPELEAGEDINHLVVPWTEAVAMACDGRIEDAKSLAAILLYDRLRAEDRRRS